MDYYEELYQLYSMEINHESIIAVIKKLAANNGEEITIDYLVCEIFRHEESLKNKPTTQSAYPQQSNKGVESESKRMFPPVNNSFTNSIPEQLPTRFGEMTIQKSQRSTSGQSEHTGKLKENRQQKTTTGQDPATNCSLLSINRDTECILCMDAKKCIKLTPCHHLVTCKIVSIIYQNVQFAGCQLQGGIGNEKNRSVDMS